MMTLIFGYYPNVMSRLRYKETDTGRRLKRRMMVGIPKHGQFGLATVMLWPCPYHGPNGPDVPVRFPNSLSPCSQVNRPPSLCRGLYHCCGYNAVCCDLSGAWKPLVYNECKEGVTSRDYIAGIIDLPENLNVECIIAIGYPDEEAVPYKEEECSTTIIIVADQSVMVNEKARFLFPGFCLFI